MFALKRPFAGVRAHVDVQVGFPAKGRGALNTLERPALHYSNKNTIIALKFQLQSENYQLYNKGLVNENSFVSIYSDNSFLVFYFSLPDPSYSPPFNIGRKPVNNLLQSVMETKKYFCRYYHHKNSRIMLLYDSLKLISNNYKSNVFGFLGVN